MNLKRALPSSRLRQTRSLNKQDISVLFCSVPFCSVLFCSVLCCFILFYSILSHSILFYSILFYSVISYPNLLLFYFTPPCQKGPPLADMWKLEIQNKRLEEENSMLKQLLNAPDDKPAGDTPADDKPVDDKPADDKPAVASPKPGVVTKKENKKIRWVALPVLKGNIDMGDETAVID